MKKFLVFLVSIIVAICLGMTFYYFAKDEEVIKIQTSTLYLNVGDSVSLDDLGFSHTHKKQETKINFNAGGEAVTSIISYEPSLKKYITTEKGGSTTIVISTNNKRFKKFCINVIVGNGSSETPFQIKTEEDLFNIGTSRFMDIENSDAHYILMNDINLTAEHDAIGRLEDGSFTAFQGNFDGNYYIINNLVAKENINGGLFGVIGEKATVKNLYLKNAKIEGNFTQAGTLAGLINGYVDRVGIIDSVVNNTNTNESYTGCLAGKVATLSGQTNEFPSVATTLRISIESTSANSYVRGTGYVGGIAGLIDDAMVEGVKVATNIYAPSTSKYCGGFAGQLILNNEGFVRESYSMSAIDGRATYSGALFGKISVSSSSTLALNKALLGLYYDSTSVNGLSTYKEIDSLALASYLKTVSGLNQSELITSGKYIYYFSNYEDEASAVYWRDSIWKIIDGQYPVLRYTDYAIPTNISISAGSKEDVTTPDNPGTDDPIDNPDIPDDTKTEINISSATTLINTTFMENHTYKLTANIDLNGSNWIGKKLPQGATFDGNGFIISNFTIKRSTNYVGFFSSIVGATVKDLTLDNVKIVTDNSFDYAGILAGVIDNGTISKINIVKSYIEYTGTTSSGFVGGLVGFASKRTNAISYVVIDKCAISGNANYVGGLAGYIGQNTKTTESNVTNTTLNGNKFVGGIAGQSDGLISKCNASTTIDANYSGTETSYIGGLVGVNANQLLSSTSENNITITNSNVSHLVYVGGIAGYNGFTNVISNCNAVGAELSIKAVSNNGIINIGGLVGLNAGRISDSKNEMASIGSGLNNIITGGLVAQNIKGNIIGCMTVADLYGNEIGGLTCVNLSGATISECAIGSTTKRVLLKGNAIAGLVYYSASGEIKDCYVSVTAHSLDMDGSTAGAVLYLPINANNENDYCTITHCIISCEFTGLANKDRYLVTASNIFSSKSRTSGTIRDCIFDTSANGASETIKPSGKSSKAVSKSNYYTSNSTYVTLQGATQAGFDISNSLSTTWYYDANRLSLPVLSRFVNN